MADLRGIVEQHLGAGESVQAFHPVETPDDVDPEAVPDEVYALTDRRFVEISVAANERDRDRATVRCTVLGEVSRASLTNYGEEPADPDLVTWAVLYGFGAAMLAFFAIAFGQEVPANVYGGLWLGTFGFGGAAVYCWLQAQDTDEGYLGLTLQTDAGDHAVTLSQDARAFATRIVSGVGEAA